MPGIPWHSTSSEPLLILLWVLMLQRVRVRLWAQRQRSLIDWLIYSTDNYGPVHGTWDISGELERHSPDSTGTYTPLAA